jgi:hypothetical protein
MFIVYKFLQYATLIKLYHWGTLSYSRHKAADDLYSAIQVGMDKFVEVYIGTYGRKEVFKGKAPSIDMQIISDKDAIGLLDDIVNFLEKDVPKYVKGSDLLNIRDEILGNVNQAKYLFTLS